MLQNAGLCFSCEPAGIDEHHIKAEQRSKGSSGEQTALTLAEAKAGYASKRRPNDLVIGGDQILEFQGDWLTKPANRTEASQTLKRLRGGAHRLISAVAVTHNGSCLWRYVDTARLTMRPFSDAFLVRYLDATGDDALTSVGAYRIEGLGIHLFSHTDGDHFTILGMPLLPLLEFLRRVNLLGGSGNAFLES